MGEADFRLSRRVRRVCEVVAVVEFELLGGWSAFGLWDVLLLPEGSLVDEALFFRPVSLEGEGDRSRWMVPVSNLERWIHSSNLLSWAT